MVGNSGHVLQLPFIDESKAHFEWAAAHNTQTQTYIKPDDSTGKHFALFWIDFLCVQIKKVNEDFSIFSGLFLQDVARCFFLFFFLSKKREM